MNGYPSGLHVGASWNKNLAYQRARYMGGEFRAKGASVALGPVVGPLGRVALGGRNWEGFSVDPYLCGSLAAETIRGIQEQGVITSVKHFIGNEQETNRVPAQNAQKQNVEAVSSNIDDKTMHELYLWPFQDAVHAGAGNIMCSYNRVNNSYGCANSKLLNGLLKTELGFQGFVVSDWNAQHAGVANANAGLDMAMPNSPNLWEQNLTYAVLNGSVSMTRIDDIATRIIATWYQLNQSQNYPAPGVGMAQNLLSRHKIVDARDPTAKQTLLNGAIEGHVLVKNTAHALPLKAPKLLSLYGYSATTATQNNPGIPWALGFESTDHNAAIGVFSGAPAPGIAADGLIISGGGSGAVTPPYVSSPFDALQQRAYEENTALLWDFTNATSLPGSTVVDAASSACLVFINAFATEGGDRPFLNDSYSDTIVSNVASQCNNTIVVIYNAGIRLVEGFVDNPNVTGIIYAHLPGQDAGRALVNILYGDVNPSGKLPYTVAKTMGDYAALAKPSQPEGKYWLFPQSDFDEGVFIDYRAFDRGGVQPRFEFGLGLSYTTFEYGGLAVEKLEGVSTAVYPVGPVQPGGQTDLWDVLVQVTCDIKNTGTMPGQEVAQLYVSIPGGPVRQLRGYEKVGVEVNGTAVVHFDLLRRDLSAWDVVEQRWRLQGGEYGIFVGASSRDLRLNGTVTI